MIAIAISGSAMAEIKGYSSNTAKLEVGDLATANGVAHGTRPSGVGIKINSSSTSTVVNKYVDLAGLKDKAEKTKIIKNLGGLDSSGVTQLDFNKWNLDKPIPDHKPLGKFSYKELPNNVYFGEWHQGSTTSGADKDRTVFYVGKDASATPVSGTATYDVVGINQYNGQVGGLWQGWTGKGTVASPENLLTGTFTANFDNKTLSGQLNRNANGGVNATNNLAINATINTATGGFDGVAVANKTINGITQGQFFGNNAASLAGVATFNDNKFDTAFGGTKK